MTCIVVIIMSVFMIFLDWKLALLSLKGSSWCAGKRRVTTTVTWAVANLATFCVLFTA